MASEYHLSESAPDWVSDLPREYRDGEGTVTREVGIRQVTDGGEVYWKAFQFIEMSDGREVIRPGYYAKSGGYTNKPLMLPPENFEDLIQFADGRLW